MIPGPSQSSAIGKVSGWHAGAKQAWLDSISRGNRSKLLYHQRMIWYAVAATAWAMTAVWAELPDKKSELIHRLVRAAIERTTHKVHYDGSYRKIAYPGGDIPDNFGVCTDLIVRVYRAIGIDLQKKVHEDMSASFAAYPKSWGLKKPDPNIDHRRIPNLVTFFRRHGTELLVTSDPSDYLPGDIVTWQLPNNLSHIGLVVDQRSIEGKRPLVVHNIGDRPKMEDMLFKYSITGHYRYLGHGE